MIRLVTVLGLCSLIVSLGLTAPTPAIVIERAWAQPNPPVVANGAAYLTITNTTATADRLLRISGERAKLIELHESLEDNGVMKMRHRKEGIMVSVSQALRLEPGGLHIMLMGLTQPLQSGESFPLILHFEHAGEVLVNINVKQR